MILETQHHNKLIFQLPTDHFDVIHAAMREINAVATEEREAHCECFCIRNGSVGRLFVYHDGRARIFGGTIEWMQVYGQVSLAYYGPGCAEGTIKELHVDRGAYIKTDMKSLQHLLDIGSEIHIAVGATICIGDQYYTKKIEQTTDTFLGNIKTVEKVIEVMDEKIKTHVHLPETHVDVRHENGRVIADVTIKGSACNCGGDCKCKSQTNPNTNHDPQKGPFTVRQLIEALQQCKNQDAPVFAYLTEAGVRVDMIRVDDGFDDNRMVDLNVDDALLWGAPEEKQNQGDKTNG